MRGSLLFSKKKRIEYIDALRGLTMILVVLQHVESYSFSVIPCSTFNYVMMTFRMPLFFFISGFITYNPNKFIDYSSLKFELNNRCRIQLLPTLIFGLLYSSIVLKVDWLNFFTDQLKLGYWFTLALLEIFIFYAIFIFILNKFSCSFLHKIVFLILLGSLAFLSKIFLRIFPELEDINNFFSLQHVLTYIPFYLAGVILSSCKEMFHRILDKTYTMAVIVLSFIFVTYFRILMNLNIEDYTFTKLYIEPFLFIINGFCGICIVYSFFRKYEHFFVSKKIGHILQFIGRRTLEIYLIHYFLLPNLVDYGCYIGSETTVVGFVIEFLLALLIIIFCLLISSVLRLSPVLAYYLLGGNNNSRK